MIKLASVIWVVIWVIAASVSIASISEAASSYMTDPPGVKKNVKEECKSIADSLLPINEKDTATELRHQLEAACEVGAGPQLKGNDNPEHACNSFYDRDNPTNPTESPEGKACALGNRINPDAERYSGYPSSFPSGYNMPYGQANFDAVSDYARAYCKYYVHPENTDKTSPYNMILFKVLDGSDVPTVPNPLLVDGTINLVQQACLTGYELGTGQGRVCSAAYLNFIGTYTTNGSKYKHDVRSYGDSDEEKSQIKALQEKACRDGYTQYAVDYRYCGDDQGCKDKLRADETRRINPPLPDPPQQDTESTQGPNILQPGAFSQPGATQTGNCGVATGYFECSTGQGTSSSSFWRVVETTLTIMVGLVGIIAIGGLIYGGIRFASAGSDAGQLNEAKTVIRNVIVGVVLFMLMWAILQYIMPNGVFK